MYQILVSRLKHRIRSNLGILLGVTLFVAVAVCHPAFLYGSLNYLLAMQWQQIIKEENVYPAALSRTGASEVKSALEARTLIKKQEEYLEKWSRYLELPFINNQQNYTLAGETAKGSYQGNSSYYQLGYMPNLENHIKVVKGNTLAEAEHSESEGLLTGAGREGKLIPCIISTRTMDEGNLVCGEVLTFPRLTDNRGKSLKFKIAGIFEERDTHDIFWKNTTSDYVQQIFLSDKDFFSLADLEGSKEVKFVLNGMLDYKKIKAQNVKEVQETIAAFESVDSSFSYSFGDTLNTYKKQCETLSVLLWVLELPCLLLLLSFLFMLSGFRIKSEAEEISMLKSRGYSRWAVVRLYMSEGGVTTFAGILIGIPLGLLFCKLAASTDSFLSFSSQDTSMYKPVWQMLIFGIMAGLLAVAILTVPAWIYSRKSIVEHNSIDIRKSPNPIWQQLFLDVILVVGTCYLLHNYNQQKEQLAAKVISGESLDPMIFVNVFLFIIISIPPLRVGII